MHYGGLPSTGGFRSIREFGVGLANIFEAAHCVLGSLGRHLGKEGDDWATMIKISSGHLDEEIGIIRDSLREYSRPIYRKQMSMADINDYKPEYRERMKENTLRQVEDIRAAGPKLSRLAKSLGKQFAENLRDGDAPAPWINLAGSTYLFVSALADAAVESVSNWPDEVGDPFTDPKAVKYFKLMEKYLRELWAWKPTHRTAGTREWLQWMAQPLSVLTKKYKDLVYGPMDDLVDEIIRDVAPKLVKRIGEQEIDEDVQEYLEGAQEGRFEALAEEYADPEPGTSADYKAGYAWGYANAFDWNGRDLPTAVKRKVVQEQIKEFRGEVTEQVVIAALEKSWSTVNPREIFQTAMRAVKQHGWKIGLVYGIGEIIENFVIPAAISAITGVPVPPGSFAWLPLNDIVFAAVVKRLGRASAVDDFDPDGHLDWYEGQYGSVRLASVGRVARRYGDRR